MEKKSYRSARSNTLVAIKWNGKIGSFDLNFIKAKGLVNWLGDLSC